MDDGRAIGDAPSASLAALLHSSLLAIDESSEMMSREAPAKDQLVGTARLRRGRNFP